MSRGAALGGGRGWDSPSQSTPGGTSPGLPGKGMRVPPTLHVVSPGAGPGAPVQGRESRPTQLRPLTEAQGLPTFSAVSVTSLLVTGVEPLHSGLRLVFPPTVGLPLLCPHIPVPCFPRLGHSRSEEEGWLLPPPSFPVTCFLFPWAGKPLPFREQARRVGCNGGAGRFPWLGSLGNDSGCTERD